MQYTSRWFLLLLIGLVALSCRKKERIDSSSSAKLEFSQDTVIFDTVFSTVGSVTHWLTVYNRNKDAVKVSSISILGNTTQFRMNVDGIPGRTVKNLEIPGKDSIFVFVEVTVNPNDKFLPFLITDQIQFITNGNDQRVDLVAYGQNARFYTPTYFPGNFPAYSLVGTTEGAPDIVEWDSILPIVIYGYAVIDEFDQLIIREGTKIYLHGGAGLWVFQGGNIRVLGTKEHPVVFQGDRLDYPYNELSGQWDRIWINEGSSNNIFNHAIIKNAFIGIQAETLPGKDRIQGFSNNKLVLQNTIIDHCSAMGMLATNYRIEARNTQVTNSGLYNFAVSGGGEYQFDHCTFANFWNEGTRTTPAVFLGNSYTDAQLEAIVASPIVKAEFNNCIIYGNNTNEFEYEQIDSSVPLNFTFDHCLLRTDIDTSAHGTYVNAILNPANSFVFKDPFEGDYHLAPGSPAINKGVVKASTPATDLDEVDRLTDAAPDLGAYEFVP